MTHTPTRSPSELAEALEARAQHTLAKILLDELDDEAAAEAAKSAELDYEAAARLRSDAARISAMDDALKPFAELAGTYDHFSIGDGHILDERVAVGANVRGATVGDLRAARTARGES